MIGDGDRQRLDDAASEQADQAPLHGPRGTCSGPECPYWGTCHCSCGTPTRTVTNHHKTKGYRRGYYLQWSPGHSSGSRASLALGGKPRTGPPVALIGRDRVPFHPVEGNVRKLLAWLVERAGSQATLATWLGVSPALVCRWLNGQHPWVHPQIVQRMVEIVRFHHRPVDPLATFDDHQPVRLATVEEQELTRREVQAEWRNYFRRTAEGRPADMPRSVQAAMRRGA